jgi:hypothetical protein
MAFLHILVKFNKALPFADLLDEALIFVDFSFTELIDFPYLGGTGGVQLRVPGLQVVLDLEVMVEDLLALLP